MQVRELMQVLEELAPSSLAEPWDNVGLLVGRDDGAARHITVALDADAGAVDEACSGSCDVLLTHHPLLFKSVNRITDRDRVGRSIHRLVRDGVSLVALHTNLDAAPGGLCAQAATGLGLADVRPLVRAPLDWHKLVGFVPPDHLSAVQSAVFATGAGVIGDYEGCGFETAGQGSFLPGESADPYIGTPGTPELVTEVRWETVVPRHLVARAVEAFIASHPYEEPAFDVYPIENVRPDAGSGRLGRLSEGRPLATFAREIARLLGAPAVTVVGEDRRRIERVAVVTGSGASFIDAASGRADVLVTGDVKYHDAEKARDLGLALICVPHDLFESWALQLWSRVLAAHLDGAGVVVSFRPTDDPPWRLVGAESSFPAGPVETEARVLPDTLFSLATEGEEPTIPPAQSEGGQTDPSELDEVLKRSPVDATRRHNLWTDGGSRGNPGPSGIGVVLEDDAGEIVEEVSATIGTTTNNVAEYQALITGLETALDRGVALLRVHMDSELIVKQMQGQYRVKNEQLKPLYERALELLQGFEKAEIRHVPRAQNARADELVNLALDGEQ